MNIELNKNYKVLIGVLPFLFLFLLVAFQVKNFKRRTAVRESLVRLINSPRFFTTLKDSTVKNQYNNFAKDASAIIPDNSRVSFVHHFPEEDHYRIRYLMKSKIYAFYYVIPEISEEAIVEKMRSSGSKYLLMAGSIEKIKIIDPTVREKTAVFELRGNKLIRISND